LDEVAWYQRNSDAQTHPVGQLKPNAWGIYDMLGNVGEWVQDWFGATYYTESPTLDPQGPPSGSYRAIRGGGYSGIPNWVRVSFRRDRPPTTAFGIRLAREEIRK
jgi:formylglycine-generating enzyme required for sulfatase activity